MTGREIRAQFELYGIKQNKLCEELSVRMRWKIYPSQLCAALSDNPPDGTKTRMIRSECERMIEEWKGARA